MFSVMYNIRSSLVRQIQYLVSTKTKIVQRNIINLLEQKKKRIKVMSIEKQKRKENIKTCSCKVKRYI